MSGKYLVDTSVLVLSFRLNADIDKKLATYGNLYVSAVTLGELYYGAERSLHRGENIADVDKVSKRVNLLNVDDNIARAFGIVKRRQERKGLILPENDLWIAATAIHYNLTLIARDHHFNWVADLSFEQW